MVAADALDVALISVSGGARDRQVTARMARVDALSPPTRRHIAGDDDNRVSTSVFNAASAAVGGGVSSFASEVGSIPGAEARLSILHRSFMCLNSTVSPFTNQFKTCVSLGYASSRANTCVNK